MSKKVKIYTTPTCPYCIMAKEFLSRNNIDFENKDVSSDREAAREMIEKSNQRAVPVIDVDGKLIVGFNKEAISHELGI
ncbi:MAG: Uxx-star family glutaredoxin-like (seleno)protein [Armatimonadota bacterium]